MYPKLLNGSAISATPVFNVCFFVLFKRQFTQYRAFVMESISFSVVSRIERGLFISVPRPWMLCVNVKNRYMKRSVSRSHVINSRFTFTSPPRLYGIHTIENRLFDFSCPRFTFTSRSSRYGIHTIENRLFDFSRSRFTFTFQVHV